MPRKARIDAPGAIHHIILRGIERKSIFKDDLDCNHFTERLGRILNETSVACYSWVLMTNHVHLLLRTGNVPISTVMRRLLTGYAQQFNRRHRRCGHLFQNRFKSILCEEETYLLELVRYIHLNPIRAGIVENLTALNSYPNSGHAVLMGHKKNDWQDTDYILGLFGRTTRKARNAYCDFVTKGIAQGRKPELVGGGMIRSHGGWAALKTLKTKGIWLMGDERILGSSDFVEAVLKQSDEEYEKRTLIRSKGMSLEKTIAAVASNYGIDTEILKSASRQRVVAKARSIICSLAVDKLMITGAEVARRLNLSPSAVSKLADRGRRDRHTKEIENQIFQALDDDGKLVNFSPTSPQDRLSTMTVN
jgi:REP element-mobilizing transposase RayT